MKILITGGSGFIGTALSRFLGKKGHQIIALGTTPPPDVSDPSRFRFIAADTSRSGPWQRELSGVDAVINLTGRTIFKRWTEAYKQQIYDSRIRTTANIVEALPDSKGLVLVSASAAGFYGNRGDAVLTETEPGGDDFLAVVCRDWEKAAGLAESKGARVVTARFGVVLGKSGGALAQMIPAYRFFVGGPIGNGGQWFPWIHMDDLLNAMDFIFQNEQITGPVNFCGEHPARNLDLAKALGKALGRPSFMKVPAFMIRLLMGELGNAVLFSQRTRPKVLLDNGFHFTYPDIQSALNQIIGARGD
ncbi:MAG: TIGR01777 family oxidoreductase [Thermodesulfobacteriota bacterium]